MADRHKEYVRLEGRYKMKRRYFFLLMISMMLLLSCPDSGDDLEDIYAGYMQEFVQDISAYAKNEKDGFIIIPQNGVELAFNYTDPVDGIAIKYIDAIDGVGVEELFYDGILNTDRDSEERLEVVQELKKAKNWITVMVSDHVNDDSKLQDSIDRNQAEGFIAFPRSYANYYYEFIPGDTIPTIGLPDATTNPIDITTLSDAKNYLYFIGPNEDLYTTKEVFLEAIQETYYDIVLIDLFFKDEILSLDDINSLKIKGGGSSGNKRLVIAYISIGSAEKYRYYWQNGWRKGSPSWIKKQYSGYSDEYWVQFWNPQWQDIIYGNDDSYIKKIIDAGFDGAYLDNVEAYYFLLHNY